MSRLVKIVRNNSGVKVSIASGLPRVCRFKVTPKAVNLDIEILATENIIFDGENVIYDGEQVVK